jgi:hypothetical protein
VRFVCSVDRGDFGSGEDVFSLLRADGAGEGVETYDEPVFFLLLWCETPSGDLLVRERISGRWEVELLMP